jgi:hypothetical protein
MSLILSGSDGLSDIDGTETTPAIRGTDANTGIFFPAADTIAFSEGGVESMRINSSGNLGIGVASPQTRLDISGSSIIATFNSSDNSNVIAVSNASTVGGYVGATGTNLILANNAGTQALKIDTNSNLFFNSGYGSVGLAFACRAWVNFNGTTNVGGFCTIRGSGNVTSVADNGTGDYTVNFTNAMPDANYSTQVTTEENLGANSNLNAGLYSGGTYSTTAVRVYIHLGEVGGFDRSIVCVSVFR